MLEAVDLGGLSWVLAISVTLLAWTTLPLWVLVSRADPPVRLLAVMGPALGLLVGVTGTPLFSEHVLMTSAVFTAVFWSSVVSVLALVVFLQPGARGSAHVALGLPGRQQALELGLLLGTAFVQILVLPLPVLLAAFSLVVLGWREVERAQRVKSELSALLAGSVLACVLFFVSPGYLWLAGLAVFLLPLLGVPLLAWRAHRVSRKTLACVILPVLLWTVGAGLELEANTRFWRQLAWMDTSALPESEAYSPDLDNLCVQTPERACPVGDRPLYVWPADMPVGHRLYETPGRVAYRRGSAFEAVEVYRLQDDGLHVTRTEQGLQIAGRPGTFAELQAKTDEAREACLPHPLMSVMLALDPKVDWTAGELVAMCSGQNCQWAEQESRCQWTEGKGYVVPCTPGQSCAVGKGGVASCPQGGCTIEAWGGAVVECSSNCTVDRREP